MSAQLDQIDVDQSNRTEPATTKLNFNGGPRMINLICRLLRLSVPIVLGWTAYVSQADAFPIASIFSGSYTCATTCGQGQAIGSTPQELCGRGHRTRGPSAYVFSLPGFQVPNCSIGVGFCNVGYCCHGGHPKFNAFAILVCPPGALLYWGYCYGIGDPRKDCPAFCSVSGNPG
jgi:hypothetical protein